MRYYSWFWGTVIRRAIYIIRSRGKETRRAYEAISELEENFDGIFNPDTRRKIAVSYGIYCPMVCEAFTGLHGRRPTKEEKRRFIYYFVCSSLLDDFVDHHLLSQEQLFNISFNCEDFIPQTFNERVFLYAHHFLKNDVKDKAAYDHISKALYEAQVHSEKQYKSKLSEEQIKDITFRKGGYAVQLCSFYPDYKTGEECWYQLGILVQLINDLFDIYKDLQDDVSTLPNRMTNIYDFESLFVSEIDSMKTKIVQLPFSFKKRQKFNLLMAGVYAFGLIAIRQLKKLQGHAISMPDLKTVTRKDLIVDMEKLGNLYFWFKYTYQHARLSKQG